MADDLNKRDELLSDLQKKYDAIGQDLNTHLSGLLQHEPLTYWDYIQVDALLGLQTKRTVFPDEMVFIMYHQINELIFKMILWEIEQVAHHKSLTTAFFTERLMRISRYFDMLTTSFDIMTQGMEVEQYMKFRNSLAPHQDFKALSIVKLNSPQQS